MNSSDSNPEKLYTDRFVKLNLKNQDYIFDNEVYYKRIAVLAETVLLEADSRAREEAKPAYLNVIGCGRYTSTFYCFAKWMHFPVFATFFRSKCSAVLDAFHNNYKINI